MSFHFQTILKETKKLIPGELLLQLYTDINANCFSALFLHTIYNDML